MNKRLLELRKKLKLSQDAFGEKLGVTRSSISNMETGRFGVTDTMIKLICSTYNVNEVWLRTGEGDPLRTANKDEEKALIIDDVLFTDDPLKLAFYKEIQKMNQAQLDLLRDMIRSFSELV